MPSTPDKTHHIELRSYRNVGWATLVLCALCIVGAGTADEYWAMAVFALFGLIGLYMVLGAGRFDMDADGVRHHSAFGSWAIRWDEITRVEIGIVDGTFVFSGDDKRFVLSPSGWWSGLDTGAALEFLIAQLRARDLPPQPSKTAAYKIMKNTRITGNAL
jgi:hypothetical protein